MSSHVIPFQHHEVVGFVAKGQKRGSSLGLAVLGGIPRFIVDVGADFFVRRIERYGERFAAHALVFERTAEKILGEPGDEPLNRDDVMGKILSEHVVWLQKAAADLDHRIIELSDAATPGGRRERVVTAFARTRGAMLAAASAAHDLIGALDSHDANLEAIQRAKARSARRPAETPEALELQLDETFGA